MGYKKMKQKKQSVKSPISKEELVAQMQHKQNVEHIKQVVRDIWPYLADQDTIYDAQTVANALSGFISAHIEKKVNEIKVVDLPIDLSKEKDSKIKSALHFLLPYICTCFYKIDFDILYRNYTTSYPSYQTSDEPCHN